MPTPSWTREFDLEIDSVLHAFLVAELIPGSGVSREDFFRGLSELVHGLGPRNRALLQRREELQSKIDDWHLEHAGKPHDAAEARPGGSRSDS